MFVTVLWTAVSLGLAAPPEGAARGAFFAGMGDLAGGEFYSQALAISADGTTAVGWSRGTDPGIPFQTSHEAFRWTAAEGMVGLGDLDEEFVFSIARDVSADGSVIAGAGSFGPGTGSAPFRWTAPEGMMLLREPSGDPSDFAGFAVSEDGATLSGLTSPGGPGTVAALWTAASGVIELGALPNDLGFPDAFASDISADGTAATGQSFGEFPQPILWTAGGGPVGLGDVPGGELYALGLGISGDGSTIVGSARTSFAGATRDEAFVWTAATGFILPDPLHGELFGSSAEAASADGAIVVGSSGDVGAMIWDAENGMRGVKEVLESLGMDLSGWTLNVATDVSADGTTIVGQGFNPAGDIEAWIARIPRPGGPAVPAASGAGLVAAALLLAAAAGVLVARRPAPASVPPATTGYNPLSNRSLRP